MPGVGLLHSAGAAPGTTTGAVGPGGRGFAPGGGGTGIIAPPAAIAGSVPFELGDATAGSIFVPGARGWDSSIAPAQLTASAQIATERIERLKCFIVSS